MTQPHWEIIIGTIAHTLLPYVTLFLMVVVLVGSELLIRAPKNEHLQRIGKSLSFLNLLIGLCFWGVMGFFEHIIHRAGSFLEKTPWEVWRATHLYDKWMVVVAMRVGLVPLAYLFATVIGSMGHAPRKRETIGYFLGYLALGELVMYLSRTFI